MTPRGQDRASAAAAKVAARCLSKRPCGFAQVATATFFSVLPGQPVPDPGLNRDPKHFDALGYLMLPDGARMSGPHLWTQRPAGANLYDVDLTGIVTYTPTIAAAIDMFTVEMASVQPSAGHVEEVPLDEPLQADESRLCRLVTGDPRATYEFDARYSNYLFHFVGRIDRGGYFESETQFHRQMLLLDQHISSVFLNLP